MLSKKNSQKWKIDILFDGAKNIFRNKILNEIIQGIVVDISAKLPKRYSCPTSVQHLSVVFTSDKRIHILNKEYRGKDKPTDVLSFPQIEGDCGVIPPSSLGDVVISIQTAKKQAKEYGVSFEEEILRLLIHGILHLFGYDHERVSKDRIKEMQDREDMLMEQYRTSLKKILIRPF